MHGSSSQYHCLRLKIIHRLTERTCDAAEGGIATTMALRFIIHFHTIRHGNRTRILGRASPMLDNESRSGIRMPLRMQTNAAIAAAKTRLLSLRLKQEWSDFHCHQTATRDKFGCVRRMSLRCRQNSAYFSRVTSERQGIRSDLTVVTLTKFDLER